MPKMLTFQVPTMTCSTCSGTIKSALLANGIKIHNATVFDKTTQTTVIEERFNANYLQNTLTLEVDNTEDYTALCQICIKAMDDMGFSDAVAIDESATVAVTDPKLTFWQRAYRYLFQTSTPSGHFIKSGVGIGFGVGFLVLSFFMGGLPIAAIYALTAFSSVLSLILGIESYTEAFAKLTKARTLEMNALFSMSSLAAIVVSIVSLFVPWLPRMLDAALLIFGFRHLGIALEDKAKQKVIEGLNYRDLVPKQVSVQVEPDVYEKRLISTIKVDDIIKVERNEILPVDGVCISEEGLFDIHRIFGFTDSKFFKKDESLYAGMQVIGDNAILMRVTHTESDSTLAQNADAIKRASLQKSTLETTSERRVRIFVPVVLALTAIATAILSVLNPAIVIQSAISFLVSACPCTLGSIVPLAINVGLAKASQHGALFMSGKALQAAADVDTVVFDLHGTLTENCRVKSLEITDPACDKEQMLKCLYKLEEGSNHAFAVAIRAYLAPANPDTSALDARIPENSTPYHGKELCINDATYIVGNSTKLEKAGIVLDEKYQSLITTYKDQIVFFAKDNKIIGHIILEYPLKNDAKYIVNEIKRKFGNDAVHLCTGADAHTAKRYADELGIPNNNIRANCNLKASTGPFSKSAYIRELQDQGKSVAMIGDTTNDDQAMKTAKLAILIPSGVTDDETEKNADVKIKNSTLTPILSCLTIAKDTVRNINQNLMVSLGYNLATLAVGATLIGLGFAINPGLGVAIMIIQAGLVLANVYRLQKKRVLQTPALVAENSASNTSTDFIQAQLVTHKPQQGVSNGKNYGAAGSVGKVVTYPSRNGHVHTTEKAPLLSSHSPSISCHT